jgi:hypothetical protein
VRDVVAENVFLLTGDRERSPHAGQSVAWACDELSLPVQSGSDSSMLAGLGYAVCATVVSLEGSAVPTSVVDGDRERFGRQTPAALPVLEACLHSDQVPRSAEVAAAHGVGLEGPQT